MGFYIVLAALFILGFFVQFFIMRRVKSRGWRLTPAIVLTVLGAYSLLRTFGVIVYPWDGSGFIDAGAIMGIIILLFVVSLAAGCLIGFIFDRILIIIRKTKQGRGQ